jgi:hypothetical protein
VYTPHTKLSHKSGEDFHLYITFHTYLIFVYCFIFNHKRESSERGKRNVQHTFCLSLYSHTHTSIHNTNCSMSVCVCLSRSKEPSLPERRLCLCIYLFVFSYILFTHTLYTQCSVQKLNRSFVLSMCPCHLTQTSIHFPLAVHTM